MKGSFAASGLPLWIALLLGCTTPEAPPVQEASNLGSCKVRAPMDQAEICILNDVSLKGADTFLRYGYRVRIECDGRVVPEELVIVRLREDVGEAQWNASRERQELLDPTRPFAKYLSEIDRSVRGAYVAGIDKGLGIECPTGRILYLNAR